jgi:hypothetical protein
LTIKFLSTTLFFLATIFAFPLMAETIIVRSQQEFDSAHSRAVAGDEIVWPNGTYTNVVMVISKDGLHVRAENSGRAIFTGTSKLEITGDNIKFSGIQYVDGNIGTSDVVNITGSSIEFFQVNIRAYTCYKYLRVREVSRNVDISYCNFENRLNLADQNILSILVDNDEPGYHKVRHCSFKNFDGGGNDDGIEPIRIGVSSQADFISRSLVEYCYFTQCDGDGELISSKARQNVYRFNTFENNTKAELVLRHGSETIVYGNFFLSGKGGVRVREGQDHYIYNNYFFNLNDRAIYLQNEGSDPLDNINIAFNTILNCDRTRLGGGAGSFPPTNVTIANNIFSGPRGNIFDAATGTETWIGNIAFGDLGTSLPSSGIVVADPILEENEDGFFGLGENSPAIDAALTGYADLPQFPGMDTIDTEVLFDLMGQARPVAVMDKDIGANEYPHNTTIYPIATEENTGPDYNTSTLTGVRNAPLVVDDLLQVYPNPADKVITLTISAGAGSDITVDLLDVNGRKLRKLASSINAINEVVIRQPINSLPAGTYTIRATGQNLTTAWIQTVRLIKQ